MKKQFFIILINWIVYLTKNYKALIAVFSLIILIAVAFTTIWFTNFNLFKKPEKLILKEACDLKEINKAIMFEFEGNATTNNSINIAITDCNITEIKKPELIFTASSPNIKPTELNFEWKSIDTLKISYNEKLEVFRQRFKTKSLNHKIVIEYKTE